MSLTKTLGRYRLQLTRSSAIGGDFNNEKVRRPPKSANTVHICIDPALVYRERQSISIKTTCVCRVESIDMPNVNKSTHRALGPDAKQPRTKQNNFFLFFRGRKKRGAAVNTQHEKGKINKYKKQKKKPREENESMAPLGFFFLLGRRFFSFDVYILDCECLLWHGRVLVQHALGIKRNLTYSSLTFAKRPHKRLQYLCTVLRHSIFL